MPVRNPGLKSFDHLINLLDFSQFEIPLSQDGFDGDFPTYLVAAFERYANYYSTSIKPCVNDEFLYGESEENSIEQKIQKLSRSILNAVDYYYHGKLPEANEALRWGLQKVEFNRLTSVEEIPAGRTFYRTRSSSDQRLTKKDLFHNPFENRGIVATSRYSIPGLPALYLGDSTYVCWEEFNQKQIKDLYFSRFRNEVNLRVVKIQRINDFLNQLSSLNFDAHKRMSYLLRYLALFPLSIACSVRTKSNTDTFKPEYIIPQLLLQYVMAEKNVQGIMFPSTKVAYDKIEGVPAYNYVFPVRQIQSKGYCSNLAQTFSLTEPTSTELEALTNFGGRIALTVQEGEEMLTYPKRISIIEGEGHHYLTTAFGFLERVLRSRPSNFLPISS